MFFNIWLSFLFLPVDHLLKANKQYKNSKKQEVQDIFLKTNYVKFVFNMKGLPRKTASDKVLGDKALFHNLLMDISVYLLQWFINLLIKKLLVVLLKAKLGQTKN